MMSNYDELLERLKDIDLISQLGSLLGWDQEVLMPPRPLLRELNTWLGYPRRGILGRQIPGWESYLMSLRALIA